MALTYGSLHCRGVSPQQLYNHSVAMAALAGSLAPLPGVLMPGRDALLAAMPLPCGLCVSPLLDALKDADTVVPTTCEP